MDNDDDDDDDYDDNDDDDDDGDYDNYLEFYLELQYNLIFAPLIFYHTMISAA